MRYQLALLLSTLALCCGRSVNYCGAKMCGHSNAHTFCQYPVGPSPKCVGYAQAGLSVEEKARITARLNRRRSEAASGRLRRFPPAGNMLKLRWVEELAREAQRWADQCRPPKTPDEYDNCRDLYSTTVGQCVTSVVGEAPGLRVESMVDMWYMQSMFYKGNVTSYVAPTSNISYYGDFAQIIWSRTYMVGCGRSSFMVQRQGRMRSVERLVCNFAPRGPIPGYPLWIVAAPATACMPKSLPDEDLSGLCSYQYNLDDRHAVYNMTLEEDALLNSLVEIEINEQLNYQGSLDELYLTKIAIATMENSISTVHYNNLVRKRDLFEIIMPSEIINMNRDRIDGNVTQFSNQKHMISSVDEATTEIVKKKINLIGRPKPYNIDDLSEVGGVQITENTRANPGDLPKRTKEFYAEYEYLDTHESNETTTQNNTDLNDKSSVIPEKIDSINHTTLDGIRPYPINVTNDIFVPFGEEANMNVSNIRTVIKSELMKLNSTTAHSNASLLAILTQKDDNDYLNDPETVQQLQEALDRMERSLETSTVRKVRRELEHFREPDKDKRKLHETNNTLDRAPMLNMVLRYMPYLKPYEKDILGSVVSASFISLPSVIFIVYNVFCNLFFVKSIVLAVY